MCSLDSLRSGDRLIDIFTASISSVLFYSAENVNEVELIEDWEFCSNNCLGIPYAA